MKETKGWGGRIKEVGGYKQQGVGGWMSGVVRELGWEGARVRCAPITKVTKPRHTCKVTAAPH